MRSGQHAYAGGISTGPVEAGDQPDLDGITTGSEDDRNSRGCRVRLPRCEPDRQQPQDRVARGFGGAGGSVKAPWRATP